MHTKNESLTSANFYKWLLLVTIFAAGLRLLWISELSIWVDELFSVRDAAKIFQDPMTSLLKKVRIVGYLPITLGLYVSGVDLTQIDITSPSMWHAQGVTPWAIRAFPVLIGIFTIPTLAVASRRILGDRTVLVLALLLAIAPWHIHWSQMGRFYIIQFLFYSLALIFYFNATWEGSRQKLFLGMGFFVLAFACQYTSIAFLLVIGGDWLFSKLRQDRLQLDRVGYLILGFTLCLGVMILVIAMLGSQKRWAKVYKFVTYPPTRFLTQTLFCIGPMVIVVGLFTQFINSSRNRRLLNFLLLAALIPIIIFSVIAFRGHNRPRYTFIGFYPWLALAAIGLMHMYEKLRLRVGKVTASIPVVLLSLSMLVVHLNNTFFKAGLRPRFNEAADYVRKHYRPGDKVIFNTFWVGEYYLSDLAGKILDSPQQVTEADQGVWIVMREKDKAFPSIFQHPILSKAKLQKTLVSHNIERQPSIIHIFYLPMKG